LRGLRPLPAAGVRTEHDKDVTKMNEVRCRASQWVQRAAPKVVGMIDEPGHPTGHFVIPLKQETTMLKTIFAALLAVSVLAAPVLAADTGKTAQAPVTKTEQAPAAKTAQAKPAKPSVLNANARMGHRHHGHFHRHHRFHKHMGALKTQKPSKVATVSTKHISKTAKHG
jgi:hypothetical protein